MPSESPDDVREIIETIDTENSSQVALVLSSEGVSKLEDEEISNFIEEIDFENFTEEENIQIMEVLSVADDAVKEIFEQEVNIFSDQAFNTYVPTGSNINVQQRRVLVAAGATIMSAAAPAAGGGRRRK
jgi:hypothetical protein